MICMEVLRTRKISKVGSSSTLANFFARGEVAIDHRSAYDLLRANLLGRDDFHIFMIDLEAVEAMV